MGAIVTVYIDRGRGESGRLLNELARWAESAYGVDCSRSGDVLDVTFAESDPGHARAQVEDVLAAANPAWRQHLGIEAVSA